MEYTNEILEKMKLKKIENSRYSKYYYRLCQEEYLDFKKYYNRSERINDCLNLWSWDKYEKNKLLDLISVNRCMNNRFCPNCKKLDLAKAIHSFGKPFKKLLSDGYYPYLLTLTLPNCTGDNLENTINFLNKSFRRLWRGFSEDNKYKFNFRELEFNSALKVLEITYNSRTKEYHPHFHCIVFSKQYDSVYFSKNIKGRYSRKRKSYNYKSNADIHISQIWTMICKKIRLSEKNFYKMPYDPNMLYECDIREMTESGIYEVFKYTFKDTDIVNYNVFKTIVMAIENKRIRQGYGELYNVKFEDVEEGDKQSLEEFLTEKENPTKLLTREISELITTYKDYRKVSRFTPKEYMNIID